MKYRTMKKSLEMALGKRWQLSEKITPEQKEVLCILLNACDIVVCDRYRGDGSGIWPYPQYDYDSKKTVIGNATKYHSYPSHSYDHVMFTLKEIIQKATHERDNQGKTR